MMKHYMTMAFLSALLFATQFAPAAAYVTPTDGKYFFA